MHVHFSVDYRAPYALRFHVEGAYAQRSFWLDDLPVVVRLSQSEPDGPLLADVYSDRSIDERSAALRAAVRHMVAADDDLHDFSAAVARDRKMTRLIEGLPGLKPLRVPDLWTTLLRSLLSQQVSTAAARAIRERLSRAHGHIVYVNDEEITVVPDVERTARLAEADLVACGLSRRKAEYARGIAQAFLDGQIDPAHLNAAPPDELIERLSSLRGVGVWTAECVGIFCIGHRDLLPGDDLGIQDSIAQLYKLGHRPKPKEVIKIGKKWAGWRSYAAIYLWGARNHGLLPAARLAPVPAPRKRAPAAPKRARVAHTKLPARRTGAGKHSPAPPGGRGR